MWQILQKNDPGEEKKCFLLCAIKKSEAGAKAPEQHIQIENK